MEGAIGMIRQSLSYGRVLVRDANRWIIYDRMPGGILDMALDGDAVGLARLLALAEKLTVKEASKQ